MCELLSVAEAKRRLVNQSVMKALNGHKLNSLTQSYVANTENLVSGAKILGQQADRLTKVNA